MTDPRLTRQPMWLCPVLIIVIMLSSVVGSSANTIDELMVELNSRIWTTRRDAARAIASLGRTAAPAVPLLIERLDDTVAEVSSAAFGAIVAIGEPSVSHLAKALESGNLAVLDTVKALGAVASPVAPVLVSLLDNPEHDLPTRIQIAMALMTVDHESVVGLQVLGNALSGEEPRGTTVSRISYEDNVMAILDWAREAGQVAEPLVLQIEQLYDSPNYRIRRAVPGAVARFRPELKARVLARGIDGAGLDKESLLSCLEELRTIGPDAAVAVPALVNKAICSLRNKPQHYYAEEAQEALQSTVGFVSTIVDTLKAIGPHGLEALTNDLVPALAELLVSDDDMLVLTAIQVLEGIGFEAREAVPALMELSGQTAKVVIDGRWVTVRIAPWAFEAIGKIGCADSGTVNRLAEILIDETEPANVKTFAAIAIAGLGPDASSVPAVMIWFLQRLNGLPMGGPDDYFIEESAVACAKYFGELGPAAWQAVPSLIRYYDSSYRDRFSNRSKPAIEQAVVSIAMHTDDLDDDRLCVLLDIVCDPRFSSDGDSLRLVDKILDVHNTSAFHEATVMLTSPSESTRARGLETLRNVCRLSSLGKVREDMLQEIRRVDFGSISGLMTVAALHDVAADVNKLDGELATRIRDTLRGNAGTALWGLKVALGSPDPIVRSTAARMIGWMDSKAAVLAPDLGRLVRDSDAQVQGEAMKTLIRMGPDAEPATAVIAPALTTTDRDLLVQVIQVLGLINTKSVDTLIRDLKDPSYDKRRAAAAVLGEFRWGAREAVKPLVAVLADSGSYRLRSLSAMALGKIGPSAKSAYSALQRAERSDSSAETRLEAAKAIRALEQWTPIESVPDSRNPGILTRAGTERVLLTDLYRPSTVAGYVSQGATFVPMIDCILELCGDDYQYGGSESWYPLNAIWLLSKIGGNEALSTLRRFAECASGSAKTDANYAIRAILMRRDDPDAGILWRSVQLYAEPIGNSRVIAELPRGTLATFSRTKEDYSWRSVTVDSKLRGYIRNVEHVYPISPWF